VDLLFSESCERNRFPILEVLKQVLPEAGSILEIGSCTGQHIVFFAPEFPNLNWQPSDQEEYLPGLLARIAVEGCDNILPAITLDVLGNWPPRVFDAAYSANTAHIMGWAAVRAMFGGVASHLEAGGVFCLYGPFNRNGEFTSSSNANFDRQLRARNPEMGIRDIRDLASLAERHHMTLERAIPLPANNQVLVFRKSNDPESRKSTIE
jgi:cyclopropane fatty-acyl-phospholipid synthase-like methyltransferase